MKHSIQHNDQGDLQHLLTIEDMDDAQLTSLLDDADRFIKAPFEPYKTSASLTGKTVANLFFEPSTRTRCSFELAAKQLGATVLNLNISTSSTTKGEAVFDTIDTLRAMMVDFLVIRHSEPKIVDAIAEHVGNSAHVINAGDGSRAHPTQSLLDMLTIRHHKPNFSELSIAMVGDIKHSRVARSNLHALCALGVPDVRLIAPPSLLPPKLDMPNVTVYESMQDGLQDVDIVIMLRLQLERMAEAMDIGAFQQHFCLTPELLTAASPVALIMHPGPVNRDVEIAAALVDCSQSLIQEQVYNGIAMRMAVLQLLGA